MSLKAGWLALFVFVWIIGAFLGSTFEYHSGTGALGQAYNTGLATFTNGSATVSGSGTAWVAGMEDGNIRADVDGIWTKIQTVNNNTELVMYSPYTGTGGVDMNYTMAPSPGYVGSGTAGYAQSPVTTLEYITNISNAVQRIPLLGNIPLPVPNGDYFKSIYRVITWQWSFMVGYEIIYWIVFAPFVIMGVFCMLLLVYGIITGNLSF